MEKRIESKRWLADRGYKMKRGASGYWRLFYGEYLAVDAPGCDDVESDEDAAAAYFMDVAEDHEGPYKEGDVYDALAAYGAYPYCVVNDRDIHEWMWALNEDGGAKVKVYTPESAAPDEWEAMCAKLRLSKDNRVRRILGADGGIICLNCDFI